MGEDVSLFIFFSNVLTASGLVGGLVKPLFFSEWVWVVVVLLCRLLALGFPFEAPSGVVKLKGKKGENKKRIRESESEIKGIFSKFSFSEKCEIKVGFSSFSSSSLLF